MSNKPYLAYTAAQQSESSSNLDMEHLLLEAYDVLDNVRKLIRNQPLAGVYLPENNLVVMELMDAAMRRIEKVADQTEHELN